VAAAAEEERARRSGEERQQDRRRDTDDGAQHTASLALVERGKGRRGGCVIGTQFGRVRLQLPQASAEEQIGKPHIVLGWLAGSSRLARWVSLLLRVADQHVPDIRRESHQESTVYTFPFKDIRIFTSPYVVLYV
jgi:hypothetical protein